MTNPHPFIRFAESNPLTNPHPFVRFAEGNPLTNPHPFICFAEGNPLTNPHPFVRFTSIDEKPALQGGGLAVNRDIVPACILQGKG